MFTFSVVFVCELVSMPTVGYKTQVSYKSNAVSNYLFPSNHIIYIYIITIIVYFIETYIYIIKTSHVLLTYKSKCLT